MLIKEENDSESSSTRRATKEKKEVVEYEVATVQSKLKEARKEILRFKKDRKRQELSVEQSSSSSSEEGRIKLSVFFTAKGANKGNTCPSI